MSKSLYEVGGLRFWSEAELEARDMAVTMLHRATRTALTGLNRAWTFERCEGPTLTPRKFIAPGYDASDLWLTQAGIMGEPASMRPETTPSTYAYARERLAGSTKALPACFWQVGKSYRRETNDGASAAKLRFNEFTQAEWQCVYRDDTKANYEEAARTEVAFAISAFTGREARVVDSDRLPAYSRQTRDVEVLWKGDWKEMCSISLRTDYAPGLTVLEIAVGLDRLVEVRAK